MRYFKSGEPYTNLPETFIIFICTFDPFRKGLPIYSFDTKCNEMNLPEYSDSAHKIFFNTTSDLSNLPNSVHNMLEYINKGVTNDTATKTIEYEVNEARLKEEWRSEYMLTVVHDNDVFTDGFTDGFANGFANGAASRQEEIDSLNAEIDTLKQLLSSNNIKDN